MTAVDVIVGRNIRAKRIKRGLSQAELGTRIGVSFQQVQKYENGTNQTSARRLVEISMSLEVPLADLFLGVAEEAKAIEARTLTEMRQEHKLIEQYSLLPDDVQQGLCVLVDAMAMGLAVKYSVRTL